MECLNTSFTTARNVNMGKDTSKYDMLNKVATDSWIYGEYGNGFSKHLNAFFTPREGDGLHNFKKADESENLICAKSDLKLGDFKFKEFLDCKHFQRDTNIQARLSEKVFVNSLGPVLGYTPHKLVLGLSSGVPGIYDVPENDNSKFS